jgi:hypothetical protein
MKRLALILFVSPLFGCALFEDGTINQSCDELGTCGGVSDGGVVYVEHDENSGKFRVSLRDGFGTEIDTWSGQGSKIGAIAYDPPSETVHLSVDNSIRVLQPGGTPKINDVAFFSQAVSVAGGTAFANDSGVLFATSDQSNFEPLALPNLRSVLKTASTESGFETAVLTLLQHLPQAGPTLVEVSATSSGLNTEVAQAGFDNSTNRAHDAFLMNGAYATCSESGATYLVDELQAGNKDPDRYPQINLGDIVSCEHDSDTDEVVLFSRDNGIGWMNTSGQIVRTMGATDGYRIVNGSVW